MEITTEDIKKDIKNFENRITLAKAKLEMLPSGYLPYQEYKNREKQRRGLQADISHLENLTKYAHEGLTILQREEGTAKESQYGTQNE